MHAVSLEVEANSSLEKLCRWACDRRSDGRVNGALRRELPPTSSRLDRMQVQVTSRRHLDYEKVVMGYVLDRWWGTAEKRTDTRVRTCEDAIRALQHRTRASINEDGTIVIQYLIPVGDRACISVPKNCYRVLPVGYQDTARQFALERAAEENLWVLVLQTARGPSDIDSKKIAI